MSHINIHLKNKSRKTRIGLRIFGVSLAILFSLFLVLNFAPIRPIETKPFFENNRPLVIAHQGGELLAPSNTMVAFTQAVELGVDAIEFDIHMTKDGYLVAIHDHTVDRTTNGEGKVSDLTLEEVQSLDAGHYFKDLEGNYSFRDQDVYIPSVEEIFQELNDTRFMVEIKETNPSENHEKITEKLWELIKQYNMEDKVVIASFDQKLIESFNKHAQGRVALSAGEDEVKRFIKYHKLFVKNLYKPKVDAFQIPQEEDDFDLTYKRLIKDAKRIGLELHYWTIDDKDTMRDLVEKGADGIITDRPDLLIELLDEMGY